MTAGGDDYVLLPFRIQLICDGHGVAVGGGLSLPQLFASFDIEGTYHRIECSGNEDQTACGDDWASQARRAGRNRCSVSNAEVLHRAERHLPANLAFRHIDGSQCPPRRRAAWHEARRKERSTEHAVRRSPLTAEFAAAFHGFLHEFLGRDYPHSERKVVRIHEQQVSLRIEGIAAPIRASDDSRRGYDVVQGGRSKDLVVAHASHPLPASLTV